MWQHAVMMVGGELVKVVSGQLCRTADAAGRWQAEEAKAAQLCRLEPVMKRMFSERASTRCLQLDEVYALRAMVLEQVEGSSGEERCALRAMFEVLDARQEVLLLGARQLGRGLSK